ncbi:MAG: hypothetical protein ABIZ81_07375, partial [Opitutaceae bacterium]
GRRRGQAPGAQYGFRLKMSPRYTLPREAVIGLLEAYCAFEIDRIVDSKDFESDARIYWENQGLPVSAERLAKSRLSFENNFRKQLQSGIPNYADFRFKVTAEEQLQTNFVIVTLVGAKADGNKFSLKIPVLQTSLGWRVVLHPEYDHF